MNKAMRTDGLSINLATVREQWSLREAVEACARLGIKAIDPWRDQVAATGLGTGAPAATTDVPWPPLTVPTLTVAAPTNGWLRAASSSCQRSRSATTRAAPTIASRSW